MNADHRDNLALIGTHLRGRSQVRAGHAMYDDALTLHGDDARSHVAAAARCVIGLRNAGAIDDAPAAKALAALVTAHQSVRSLGGSPPERQA